MPSSPLCLRQHTTPALFQVGACTHHTGDWMCPREDVWPKRWVTAGLAIGAALCSPTHLTARFIIALAPIIESAASWSADATTTDGQATKKRELLRLEAAGKKI
jgi:hypothetical protein